MGSVTATRTLSARLIAHSPYLNSTARPAYRNLPLPPVQIRSVLESEQSEKVPRTTGPDCGLIRFIKS